MKSYFVLKQCFVLEVTLTLPAPMPDEEKKLT